MTLQSSGAISLANIQTEFGGSNPISLSEYYRNGAYVGSTNTSVPTSGTISMSQFYGTSSVVPFQFMGGKVFKSSGGSTTQTATGMNTHSGGTVAAGDVLFVLFAKAEQQVDQISLTDPSALTLLDSRYGNDTSNITHRVYYYIAPSSPATSFSWTTNYTGDFAVITLCFRGLTLTGGSPAHQVTGIAGTNTARPDPAALTASTRGRYLYFGSGSYSTTALDGGAQWNPSQPSWANGGWFVSTAGFLTATGAFAGYSTSTIDPPQVVTGIDNNGQSANASTSVKIIGNT